MKGLLCREFAALGPALRFCLSGGEGVEPQFAHTDPLPALARSPSNTNLPWEALFLRLGDDKTPPFWDLLFAPAYFQID